LEVFVRVEDGFGDAFLARGDQVRGSLAEARHSTNGFGGQVEATHRVQHHHLERRCGRALFVESAHVDAIDIRVPMNDLVDRPLVPMKREDHWLVGGEQFHELVCGHAVRVIAGWEQPHQVDDIDHAYAQVGYQAAQPPRGGHGFEHRDVAGAAQHYLWLA